MDTPRSRSVDGGELPSARVVSNNIFRNLRRPREDNKYSMMAMAWGQFLDHDITLTPLSEGIDCKKRPYQFC